MKSPQAAGLSRGRLLALAAAGAVLLGCTWIAAAPQPPGDDKQAEAAYRQALATLAKAPQDAAANFVVGKYLVLVKNDWDKGLPHLAKGNNLAYKLIARAEIGGRLWM